MVWAGDATPVFNDSFGDGVLLDQWAVATGTSATPWSIDATNLKAQAGPNEYLDLRTAVAGQETWANYAVDFYMKYDAAAGSVGEQIRLRTQGAATCNYTDCYALEFYHVGANQYVTHLDGSSCPSRPCANSVPIVGFDSDVWRHFVIEVRNFDDGSGPYSTIWVYMAPMGAPVVPVASYTRTSNHVAAGYVSLVIGTSAEDGALVRFDNLSVFRW